MMLWRHSQWSFSTAALMASILIASFFPALTLRATASSDGVSIEGTAFYINGAVTYPGTSLEGLLMNSRMVQAVFDDENPGTVGNWAYADSGKWDPARNTNEFIAAIPDYASRGLKAITVGLQGGRPHDDINGQNVTTAFSPSGQLKAAWMTRLDQVLTVARDNGMVVIVQLFYGYQDHRLSNANDSAAVKSAVDNVVDWLIANRHTHVMVEINNECNGAMYSSHPILQPNRVDELIKRVKERSGGEIEASTSFSVSQTAPSNVRSVVDFFSIHTNGRGPEGIKAEIAEITSTPEYKTNPRPIVISEDGTSIDNMDAAASAGASWGYYDRYGFQRPPVDWTIDTGTKEVFFSHLASKAGAQGPPTQEPANLWLSTSSDRSSPQLLDGQSVSGDIYVFVEPVDGIDQVDFYIDDVEKARGPYKTELRYPFDLGGTAPSGGLANPFDTAMLADGPHKITAHIRLNEGGTITSTADIAVVNSGVITTPTLRVSAYPDRSLPVPLEGSEINGKVYIFGELDRNVEKMLFYLDDPLMAGPARQVEANPPFDFSGGSVSLANPFDSSKVTPGVHTVTAVAYLAEAQISAATAAFTVTVD